MSAGLLRVLVADDDEFGRDVLAQAISMASPVPVAVLTAATGAEALAIASESEPHVVILDLQMPVMDGFEAAQAIRKHNSTRPPLLVALSGSSQLVKLAAEGTVFDHALRKPVSVEHLVALLLASTGR